MMHNIDNTKIIKSICLLQNDLKDIGSSKISLCDKEVFKEFYIARGFENDFFNTVKEFDDILLTGRAGSGKSTLIKKVLSENEDFCDEKNFCIVMVNCETEIRINTSDNIFSEIEKYIYNNIYNKYIGVTSYKKKEKFGRKILYSSIVMNKNYRHDEAQYLINKYTSTKRVDIDETSFNTFFDDLISSKDDLKNDYNYFLNNIFERKEDYLPSLLHYVNETEQINFLFVLDNVDSLPHSKQIETYKKLLNFKNNINNENMKIKTIISLRDENYRSRNGAGVLRIEHFNIMRQANDSLIATTEDKERGEILIFKILSNKISYLMKHRIQKQGEDTKVIDASSLSAIARLLIAWSEKPYIVGDVFKYSNYSIRHAMYNILDFLLWIIGDLELEFNVLKNKKILEINSLYIAWIASKKKVIQKIEGLDLVQLERKVKESQYTDIGCDISILILNFIKNKNKNALGLPRVKFSEVVEEFSDFASRQKLKQITYDMYMLSNEVTQAEEYGHIIYMPMHDDTFKIDDIKDDTLLALYPRAEELLFLSQTFTFINIILEGSRNKISVKDYFGSYDDNIGKYIDDHYNFLKELVKVHIIELYRIYNKWEDRVSSDENWYNVYLQSFSLNEKFQIEHIVKLEKAFLSALDRNKYKDEIFRLEELQKQYLQDIQNIPLNVKNNRYVYTSEEKTVDIKKYIVL